MAQGRWLALVDFSLGGAVKVAQIWHGTDQDQKVAGFRHKFEDIYHVSQFEMLIPILNTKTHANANTSTSTLLFMDKFLAQLEPSTKTQVN